MLVILARTGRRLPPPSGWPRTCPRGAWRGAAVRQNVARHPVAAARTPRLVSSPFMRRSAWGDAAVELVGFGHLVVAEDERARPTARAWLQACSTSSSASPVLPTPGSPTMRAIPPRPDIALRSDSLSVGIGGSRPTDDLARIDAPAIRGDGDAVLAGQLAADPDERLLQLPGEVGAWLESEASPPPHRGRQGKVVQTETCPREGRG
jgi:hypothetical protein